jgi:hypothetical protein
MLSKKTLCDYLGNKYKCIVFLNKFVILSKRPLESRYKLDFKRIVR